MVLAWGNGQQPWPTNTVEMGQVSPRSPDPRRRFWRRFVVVLGVLVVATAALLVYLLSTDDQETGAFGPLATAATELRTRAVNINATWDEQEDEVSEVERSELYGETERQLETLAADTRAFADLVTETSESTGDRARLDAAAADMTQGADQMLEGLRAPGRTNKEPRLTALDLFLSASDEVLTIAGS